MLKLILLIFVLSPLIYANHHDSVTCLLKKRKVDEHKHLINCIYKCGKEKQVIQNSKKISCPLELL